MSCRLATFHLLIGLDTFSKAFVLGVCGWFSPGFLSLANWTWRIFRGHIIRGNVIGLSLIFFSGSLFTCVVEHIDNSIIIESQWSHASTLRLHSSISHFISFLLFLIAFLFFAIVTLFFVPKSLRFSSLHFCFPRPLLSLISPLRSYSTTVRKMEGVWWVWDTVVLSYYIPVHEKV